MRFGNLERLLQMVPPSGISLNFLDIYLEQSALFDMAVTEIADITAKALVSESAIPAYIKL